jgi:ribosomal protein S18 acetylase RimI-like enzyme
MINDINNKNMTYELDKNTGLSRYSLNNIIQIQSIQQIDYTTIEKIGKLCLPIYYYYDDLSTMGYNKYQLMFKAVNVTENKKEIIGFIIAEKQENNLRIHIKSIAVLPEYRRSGVGSLLINHIKQLPCLSVTLIVSEKNEDAYRFYLKMGFKPIKKLPNYYHSLNQSGYLLYFENVK